MTLGQKIHDLRMQKDMTMEELAQKIGVQRSAVNKYEKGIVVNLKRSTIAALARVFDVSPSYFLDDDDPSDGDEETLLKLFRQLNPEGQNKLSDHARDLVYVYGKKDQQIPGERPAASENK